jgi:hypothetical protein
VRCENTQVRYFFREKAEIIESAVNVLEPPTLLGKNEDAPGKYCRKIP